MANVRMRAAGAAFVLGLASMTPAVAVACPRADALGVARTVEIDTTGGPGFGMQHYKAYDFLQPKEVVLTFDDGPQKFATEAVLAALAEQCTKATFFSIGKMALGYPEILREVAKGGHTIGTHTWSHMAVGKAKSFDVWKDEMERGVSGVKRAVGGPIAPFFRYPTLKDSPESIEYLGSRNISMFSTDIDSFDFKLQPPEKLASSVIDKLDKAGKGIVLMHDIHKNTAKALPILLKGLKDKGYKVVHLTAKDSVESLAEFDAAIEKDAKGLPQAGAERPTSSVVRTIEGEPTPEEAAKSAPAGPKTVTSPRSSAPPVEPSDDAAAAPPPAVPSPAAAVSPPPAADQPQSTTTSSISPVASPVKDVGPDLPSEADAAPEPEKGLSQKAGDLWRLWFGK